MMKYGVLSVFILILMNNIKSDCIYTSMDGNFCNCDGTNENCLVAAITWEECGDLASELHVKLNTCQMSHAKEKKDKKKVAYKQLCANGDVARQWYTTEDCTGAVSKVEKLSAQYQECATITCIGADANNNNNNNDNSDKEVNDNKSSSNKIIITFILSIFSIIFISI
mmetsp:Transcript_42364/g.37615  ORF Transcript_42364/g.37615 Transcript_42364/m.37615 type:complete len:168 (+) Transcript_42364:74-577(+)